MPEDNVRVSLEKEASEAYKEEYKDLLASFQGMDTKAQGVVAIAGIFIGGLFAFLNSSNFVRTPSSMLFLLVGIIVLIGSVLLAILVLRVRDTAGVPPGQQTSQILDDLFALTDDAIKSALPGFYGDKSRAWGLSVDAVRIDVEKKSDLLWGAQLMLAVGVSCVALMTILKLLEAS
jgi:hypothetical protein